MTAQQPALTRLLDWAAGEVAMMRASYATDEDGWIYDEEIREEVNQVDADIAALNGLEERIRKLECDLGAALQRAELAEQRLAEVREENRGLRQETLILERRGDRLDVALEAIELFCRERRAALSTENLSGGNGYTPCPPDIAGTTWNGPTRADCEDPSNYPTPSQRQDALEALDELWQCPVDDDERTELCNKVRRALSEPAVLGNCMYCDRPVHLGEQAERHFIHTVCDALEREFSEVLEGEKMQPCWGDFMSRIAELGITDPSEIAKAGEPAVPEVDAGLVLRLQQWLKDNPRPDGTVRISAHDLQQLLDRVHSKPAVPEAVRQIMDELHKAREKFPQWPDDPIHAAAVVQEEAGELVQATLQSVYEPNKADYSHAQKEAVQLGAMAIRFIENMEAYRTPPMDQHDDRALAQHGDQGRVKEGEK